MFQRFRIYNYQMNKWGNQTKKIPQLHKETLSISDAIERKKQVLAKILMMKTFFKMFSKHLSLSSLK